MGSASVVTGVIGLVISAAGAVQQMSAAAKAEKRAEEQASLQQKQIAEQRKQTELENQIAQRKAARASRIAAAQQVGQTGGLVGGSVITDPLVSQQSSLTGALDLLAQQQATQNAQYDISSSQVGVSKDIAISEATASIWKSIYGFAGSAVDFAGTVDWNDTSSATAYPTTVQQNPYGYSD